jgi:DNA repair protein RadD
MTIINLLSRLDDTFFQEVLGTEVLGTLNYFDHKYLSTQNLHDILTNTFSNSELLQNPIARKHLIMCLRPVELNDFAEQLGVTPTDDTYEYVSSLSYKGELLKELFEYFEEEMFELEVPEFISTKEVAPGYPLYPYQSAVLKKLTTFLQSEQNRALLHMPTGSGKTRTAISYICRYMVEHPGNNVVWFANTKELLDQAFDEFGKA